MTGDLEEPEALDAAVSACGERTRALIEFFVRHATVDRVPVEAVLGVSAVRGYIEVGVLRAVPHGTDGGLPRPDAGLNQRCALIEAERASYSIEWMCRMLGVARSARNTSRRSFPAIARKSE